MKMWNICDVYIVRRLPPRIVQEEVFNFGKSIGYFEEQGNSLIRSDVENGIILTNLAFLLINFFNKPFLYYFL